MWECLSEQYEKTNKIDAITFVSSIHNLSTCKKVTTLKPFYNHGTIACLGFINKHALSSPTTKLLKVTSQPNPIKLDHWLYSSTKCAKNNNLRKSIVPITMATTIPMLNINSSHPQPISFDKSIRNNHQTNYNHQRKRNLCTIAAKDHVTRRKIVETSKETLSNNQITEAMTCNDWNFNKIHHHVKKCTF